MNLILSIESSCDDSSIALTNIDTLEVIEHLKISQESKHCEYGGVVPELASRLHAVALPNLLEKFKPYFKQIKAVAVTTHPNNIVSQRILQKCGLRYKKDIFLEYRGKKKLFVLD